MKDISEYINESIFDKDIIKSHPDSRFNFITLEKGISLDKKDINVLITIMDYIEKHIITALILMILIKNII